MTALGMPPDDRIEALCRRWQIRELSLFGSNARNEARADSDVDLLVDYDPGADWSLIETARACRAFRIVWAAGRSCA
jgi:predicted nucleotidyltransferase